VRIISLRVPPLSSMARRDERSERERLVSLRPDGKTLVRLIVSRKRLGSISLTKP